MANKNFSLRIDSEMLDKLHYIADYEGRSANSQINIIIREHIKEFENQNGKSEFEKK